MFYGYPHTDSKHTKSFWCPLIGGFSVHFKCYFSSFWRRAVVRLRFFPDRCIYPHLPFFLPPQLPPTSGWTFRSSRDAPRTTQQTRSRVRACVYTAGNYKLPNCVSRSLIGGPILCIVFHWMPLFCYVYTSVKVQSGWSALKSTSVILHKTF